MNQESNQHTKRIRNLMIALLALSIWGLSPVFVTRIQADKPVPEAVTNTSDNIEQDSPSAAQIARLKLREAAKAAPQTGTQNGN
ncbi:MAG: hypothetical protein KDA70_19960 [Planctomycetaceae bacterium]|nr:hypothetical protein [Planctomycetaceae bacterium]